MKRYVYAIFLMITVSIMYIHANREPHAPTLDAHQQYQISRLFNNNPDELRDTVHALPLPAELRTEIAVITAQWLPQAQSTQTSQNNND